MKPIKWMPVEKQRQIYFEFICCFLFYTLLYTVFLNLVLLKNVTAFILLLPLVTGILLFLFIRLFGTLSGAHINPIFTMAITLLRLMPVYQGLCYVLAQFSASTLACLLVSFLYRESFGDKSYAQVAQVLVLHRSSGTTVEFALEMEFLLTFLLIFVAFCILLVPFPKHPNEKESSKVDIEASLPELKQTELNSMAILTKFDKEARDYRNAMHISLLIALLIWMGGASSAAVYNPARAFAPALVSGDWEDQWIYWTGQICGGLFGLAAYKYGYARIIS